MKKEKTLEEKIGRLISNLRNEYGDTLERFSRGLEIPKEILKKIEKGKFKIILKELEKYDKEN